MNLLSFISRTDHRHEISEIAPHQLSRLKRPPLIIDVREEREYLLGHIEGAVHASRNTLESKASEIAPELDAPIVVYCAVGNRAASAAEMLHQLGYRNISWLKGGLQNWLEAGGLVECPNRQRTSVSRV